MDKSTTLEPPTCGQPIIAVQGLPARDLTVSEEWNDTSYAPTP